MKADEPDLFDPEGLEHLLRRGERDPAASAHLDFLADLVAAAELERVRLARPPAPVAAAPRPHLRPWLLALAASVLLLLALELLLGGERRDLRSLASRAPPRYVATELRTPTASADGATIPAAAFARAMEPYAAGDWAAAADELAGFLAQFPDHGPARFYLAATREQLGELERAEEHYLAAAAASDALLSAHARFRLALLWLARAEHGRARAELAALRDEGSELAGNARELLESLGPP